MLCPATLRDLRELLAAKKRKREPLRFRAEGVVQASMRPRDARAFEHLRALLRSNRDFGRASERLDALEHALRKRSGLGLPLPNEVIQNPDRSLALFWDGGVSVRAFREGLAYLIGGSAGKPGKGVTLELVEALTLRARFQAP
jgi:hypothetical protein